MTGLRSARYTLAGGRTRFWDEFLFEGTAEGLQAIRVLREEWIPLGRKRIFRMHSTDGAYIRVEKIKGGLLTVFVKDPGHHFATVCHQAVKQKIDCDEIDDLLKGLEIEAQQRSDDEQALRTMWSILTAPDPKRAEILMQDKYSERLRRELLTSTGQSLHELAQADRAFQKFMRRAIS